MDFKEVFGEELGTQLQAVVEEKKINLIVDDREKPSFIPKSRFDEVIGSKNELKTQVGELSNELETLKKSAKGNDELTAAIQELQNKNNDWETRYNKTLIDNAVKMEALHNKALDPSDLSKFLDYTTLTLDEAGAVTGLTEQIAQLKESKTYLFEQEKQAQNNQPLNPVDVRVKKTLEEQYEEAVKNGNQTLAIALKNKMFFSK
jgi:hypothetical protein